jgi:uncharacterized membrane protein YhaH (DUF805 family)
MMTQWHYARNGERAGPVDDDALRALIDAKVVTAETLVWRQGFADWMPLSQTDFINTGSQIPPSTTPSSFESNLRSDDNDLSDFGPPIENKTIFEYFKECYTKNYVNFHGRARRKEYWSFQLMYFLVILGTAIIAGLMGGFDNNFESDSPSYLVLTLFLVVFILGSILPSLAVTVRRLHDIGMTGWVILVGLIPYIGWFIIMVMSFIPSQSGDNQYGRYPKN